MITAPHGDGEEQPASRVNRPRDAGNASQNCFGSSVRSFESAGAKVRRDALAPAIFCCVSATTGESE
jgi:hypothetical protein